ncbi:MAG: DNA-binding response regulator [Zetaproteobacteria bacterium CG2_30_46_52]|nr:MAG: DNA-binding response regulator [Zetaproteobacteria bacterium CG2_30_46_52]
MDAKAKHILLVEDDVAIARLIEIHLQREGYQITVCGDGLDAQALMAENPYDLVVLDRMLPGRRGLDVLRWIRGKEGIETLPVLMVTALTMAGERVRGLNEGADDYLGKPFEPDELVARVGALLRRSRSLKTETFDSKAIQLNPETMDAMIDGQPVSLRLLEFKLLQTMMSKPGFVFSREALLDKVWGVDTFVDERTVDVTVKRLRKELAAYGQHENIQTVRGLGYRYREKA